MPWPNRASCSYPYLPKPMATLKPISKKRLGSYPSLMVVFSITLALFMTGLFGLLVLNALRLTDKLKKSVEVQVFLHRHVEQEDVERIKAYLARQPYVLQDESGPRIQFESRDSSAKKFIAETGEDFVKFLGENPLLDGLIINITEEYGTKEKLRFIKRDLEKVDGVFEVTYVENLIQTVFSNLSKVGGMLLGFSLLLMITVVLMINNTIRLAMYSQRFLIRSMQLVGAQPWFIQGPFIRRATWLGTVAGAIAVAMLLGSLQVAYTLVPDLSSLKNYGQDTGMLAAIVILGAVIGFVSSWVSVRKYLAMSLDELY